jgi:arginyl-tRNA--protein-N-Asp/Glu arginylyltransferase
MRVLARQIEEPRACSYLPDRRAQLETLVMEDVSPAELELLLERGVRRFGPAYFRPRCAACQACDSLRVVVAEHRPTRSQRRAMNAARPLRRVIGRPRVDGERLALYARWHQSREAARGWEPNPVDLESYALHFAWPHPSAREVAFRDPARADALVALGLWDVTARAASAVFFFFDPAYASRSLGIANVALGIEDARRDGRAHVYLGYRVHGCPSLEYKGRFAPAEQLVGRPRLDEAPEWARVDAPQIALE